MRFSTSVRAFAALLLCFLSTAVSQADEPLRWKFKAGDKYNYNMKQDMNMNMDAGPAGKLATTAQQNMDMNWAIQSVNPDGGAVIKQSIDRIRVKMTAPGGQGFDYDSDDEGPAVGMAAMVAPTFKAMTAGTFEFTISPRGEVTDVKVSPELLEALKNAPGNQAGTDDAKAAEQFKQMVSQVAFVLPEKAPAKGETWSTKIALNNPAAGNQTVETTYTFEGTREVDGITFAVIKPAMKMELAGNPSMEMKMKEQKTDGEVLFNIEAGRLHSMSIDQDIILDIIAGGQTIPGTIDQKIEVTVTPGSAGDTAEKSAPKVKTKVLAE
jgi:hypothetical protein